MQSTLVFVFTCLHKCFRKLPIGNDRDGQSVLHALVTEGLVSLYVDTLRTLRTLSARGGHVLPSLEDLVLRSLLTMVSASSGAQASVAAAGGLQVLIDNVGFPKKQAAQALAAAPSRSATVPAPPRVLRGAGGRPVEDELRVQLLSVQVLAQCTANNRGLLSKVKEAGGFERLTQLLQWAALTFALPEEGGALSGPSDSLEATGPGPPEQGPPSRGPSRRFLETGDAFQGPFFQAASDGMQAAASLTAPQPSASSPVGEGPSPASAKPPTPSRRPPLGGALCSQG